MKFTSVGLLALSIISIVNATPIPADTDLKATSSQAAVDKSKQTHYPPSPIHKRNTGYSVDKIVPRDDHHGSNYK